MGQIRKYYPFQQIDTRKYNLRHHVAQHLHHRIRLSCLPPLLSSHPRDWWSHRLSLPRCASSTSLLLNTSVYPPSSSARTVLGVILPCISRLFRWIRARARSRSEDSRVSRAATSGGALGGNRRARWLLEGAGADIEEREASWRVMEVRGSCMDFRAVSRFL